MKILANIIWHFPYFGFLNAIITFLIGGVFVLTVVGAPIGLGLIQLSKLYLAPFGHYMVDKKQAGINDNLAWSSFSFVIRILYFPIGCLLLAFTIAQMIGCVITVVGFPVAVVVFKSLGTIWNPVNKVCV